MRPHRRSRRTVQSYSPGGANVPSSPQPKLQIDRFSRFCKAYGRKSLFFAIGAPFPKIASFHAGIWTYIEFMIPWVSPSTQPKQNLDRFSHFCTDDHRVPLYFAMGRAFLLKITPSHGGCGPHLIRGSLGPPESSTQTASQSLQPFLHGSLV